MNRREHGRGQKNPGSRERVLVKMPGPIQTEARMAQPAQGAWHRGVCEASVFSNCTQSLSPKVESVSTGCKAHPGPVCEPLCPPHADPQGSGQRDRSQHQVTTQLRVVWDFFRFSIRLLLFLFLLFFFILFF